MSFKTTAKASYQNINNISMKRAPIASGKQLDALICLEEACQKAKQSTSLAAYQLRITNLRAAYKDLLKTL